MNGLQLVASSRKKQRHEHSLDHLFESVRRNLMRSRRNVPFEVQYVHRNLKYADVVIRSGHISDKELESFRKHFSIDDMVSRGRRIELRLLVKPAKDKDFANLLREAKMDRTDV